MEKRALAPTEEDFLWFQGEIVGKEKFSRIASSEFARDQVRYGLQAPYKRTGREIGYRLWRRGLTVKVWTTVLEGPFQLRKRDVGWVLIVHDGSGRYFRDSIRRKKFFSNLLNCARLAKWRIEHRWPCQHCGKLMHIISKEDGGYFWGCDYCWQHGKKSNLPWDYQLPEDLQKLAMPRRIKRKNHRDSRKAQGLPVNVRKRTRRTWKRTR